MGPNLLSHVHDRIHSSTIHTIRSVRPIHPPDPIIPCSSCPSLPPRNSKIRFWKARTREEREGGQEISKQFPSLSLSLSLGSDQSCLPPPLSLPRPRLLLPPTRRKSIAEIQVHHTGRAAAAAALVGLAVDVGGARRRRHAPARPRSVRPRPPRRRRRDLIQPVTPAARSQQQQQERRRRR